MTLAIALLSLAAVLGAGLAARRLGGRDEFFLAGRSIGPLFLLLTLFGTHMTSFALLGAAAESYRKGIGVFAMMASSSALVVPLVFLVVGVPLWRIARREGHVTPIGWLRSRFRSERFALAMVAASTALLIPYLLVGLIGAGVTLQQASGGRWPEAAGSFLVAAVIAVYVTAGGMRSTVTANALQTLFFTALGGVAVVIVLQHDGGLAATMQKLVATRPELATREGLGVLEVATWAFVPLSAAAFPHLALHWMAARSAASFRLPMVAYPALITLVWVPSVLLGLVAALELPGLTGPATNGVLVALLARHAGAWLAGLLFAGVLAAVMSSLDSQALSLGALFTHDVIRRRGGELDEARQMHLGRIGVVLVLLVTWLISLLHPVGIFRLGSWAFAGFAALAPIYIAGLHWRRASRTGAWAALGVTVVAWLVLFFGGHDAVTSARIHPAAVLTILSTLALIVGSLLRPDPQP